MKGLCLTVAGWLALSLAGGIYADDKKVDKNANKDKVVGTWEMVKGTLPEGSTLEFTKDGKAKLVIKAPGRTVTQEGTYSVDGDKIMLVRKLGDQELKETLQITTLTDKMLITVDEAGKTDEFKKQEKKGT
jgi:uncharacterized protein (TIGR03066 family)